MKQPLHLAKVIDNADPENMHRVQVALLNRPDDQALIVWARVAQPYATAAAGIAFRPEIDDEVILAYDRELGSEPIILGSLYNGAHELPAPQNSMGNDHTHVIKTTAGHEIALHDGDDGGVAIRTNNGNNIEVDNGESTVRITTAGGNSITIDAAGKVEIQATSIELNASATIDLTASIVKLNSGMIDCSGVLKSDTLITNSVVASSYTPGAGNVW